VGDGDAGGDDARGQQRADLDHQTAGHGGAGAQRSVGGGVHTRAGRPEQLEQRERDHRGHRLAQVQTRPVHQLAHGALRQPHGARHVRAREAEYGRAQEGIALTVRQGAELGQRRAGGGAELHRVLQRLAVRDGRVERRVDGQARPGHLMAKDLMQPATEVANLAAALKGRERVEKRLLDRVLASPV
jgi:hypothetical protein